jgi:hypothetical protein
VVSADGRFGAGQNVDAPAELDDLRVLQPLASQICTCSQTPFACRTHRFLAWLSSIVSGLPVPGPDGITSAGACSGSLITPGRPPTLTSVPSGVRWSSDDWRPIAIFPTKLCGSLSRLPRGAIVSTVASTPCTSQPAGTLSMV